MVVVVAGRWSCDALSIQNTARYTRRIGRVTISVTAFETNATGIIVSHTSHSEIRYVIEGVGGPEGGREVAMGGRRRAREGR